MLPPSPWQLFSWARLRCGLCREILDGMLEQLQKDSRDGRLEAVAFPAASWGSWESGGQSGLMDQGGRSAQRRRSPSMYEQKMGG